MNRRRSRAWLLWALPAFFLRSLIPLGFMPTFGPGLSVQLALCETYAPVPAMDMSKDMSMDMGTDIPQAPHGDRAAHQDHGICLFGAGPVFGAPLAHSAAAPAQQQAPNLTAFAPQVNHFDAPYRAQSARGPPV
jgi:hypothetical protein